MKFAAFYSPDGVVKYIFGFQDDDPPQTEEPWVEVSAGVSPDDGWVQSGSWTAYSAEGAARKKSPPPYPASWSPITQTWTDLREPAERVAQQWAAVRTQRNRLLLESDWTDTYSAPTRLGETLYSNWQTYRQALRDVTLQPDPFNITWPTPPG